jgi:hypothetical protein
MANDQRFNVENVNLFAYAIYVYPITTISLGIYDLPFVLFKFERPKLTGGNQEKG